MSEATSEQKTWLNGLLFVLTVLTVWTAGLVWSAGFARPDAPPASSLSALLVRAFRDTGLYPMAALYAAVLMTILVGHELGHYLTCRRHGVRATLPFFMPGPPFLGTFGAFIRIKSPLYFKRQVFDIGANGPLAGFILTVPMLAVGMSHSRVIPIVHAEEGLFFGEPLLFRLMSILFFGRIPEGSFLNLHPIVWAGWVGLLMTALNLLPIGQLDGGHIAYALLGRRARPLSVLMVGLLVVMGVFFHMTWLFLAVLILVLEFRSKTGLRHPPVLDEDAPLGRKRAILSAVVIAIFILSFVPDPVRGFGLLDLLKGRAGGF
jgi:hypothetical protein